MYINMFLTAIFIVGGLAAFAGWSPLAFLLGLALMANVHPSGSGWYYLAMVVILLVANSRVKNYKEGAI